MRQTKRFAVVGSDARQAAAGRALARAGYTVGGVQQLPQADCILLPLPLEQSGLPLAQLLGMAKPGALALGGKVTDSARTIARRCWCWALARWGGRLRCGWRHWARG